MREGRPLMVERAKHHRRVLQDDGAVLCRNPLLLGDAFG